MLFLSFSVLSFATLLSPGLDEESTLDGDVK